MDCPECILMVGHDGPCRPRPPRLPDVSPAGVAVGELRVRLLELAGRWDYEAGLSLSAGYLWSRCATELRTELER